MGPTKPHVVSKDSTMDIIIALLFEIHNLPTHIPPTKFQAFFLMFLQQYCQRFTDGYFPSAIPYFEDYVRVFILRNIIPNQQSSHGGRQLARIDSSSFPRRQTLQLGSFLQPRHSGWRVLGQPRLVLCNISRQPRFRRFFPCLLLEGS